MTPEVGSKAPDFTLPDQDFQPVTPIVHQGQHFVVLAFFPAAFSSVCAKEMCALRDSMAQLNHAQAKVYGISVDTPFTLKVFAREQQLNFPLLSDFNKEVIRKFGVVNEDMLGLKGISKRAVFLIDKSGVVRYREILAEPGLEPDYGKLHQAIANQ